MDGVVKKSGRRVQESDLGIRKNQAMIVEGGKIQWIGSNKKIPKKLGERSTNKARSFDLNSKTVLPGFVECHTHSVFAGDRSAEFEMRNLGVPYQEIAAKGGGILHSMRKTRQAPEAELTRLTQSRVDQFTKQGVTTLEIKSGYALNLKDELKSLRVAAAMRGPRIVPTFLGAHAKPPEFLDTKEYLDFLQFKVLPKLKKSNLSERVDIFIEKGFFPVDEARQFLQSALEQGFDVTIHADQLSLCGGTDLAVEIGALSADHVIQLGDSQISKLAKSETVAVLLPMADLYMKCAYPPARKLIDAGACVAIATDFNPGTCPSQDLALTGLLARLEMKMSLPEVIAAYTWNAAKALKLETQVGFLATGTGADFISIESDWNQLFYSAGNLPISTVHREGREIWAK